MYGLKRSTSPAVGSGYLLTPASLLTVVGAAAAGLLPYLYLLLSGLRAPYGSWGDTTTWAGFMTHLLRKEYGTFRLFSGNGGQRSGTHVARLVRLYLGDLCHGRLGWAVPVLIGVGMLCNRALQGG